MTEITAKDRIEATFRGEYLDRVPIHIGCSGSDYIVDQLGYTRNEVLTDRDKALKALQFSHKEFPSDIIGVPADPLLPANIAARSALKKSQTPSHRGPMFENKSDLAGFKPRDPRESKSYKPFLEMVGRVKDLFPDHPVVAMAPGVWSNAAEMRGSETFLYDTVDDPDFVHSLLRVMTDLAKARGEALVEAGTDMLVFGDPSAGCSFISPKVYTNFVKPYHSEIVDHIKDNLKVRVGFHICGFTDPVMDDIASLSLDWFELDAPSSMEKMKEASKGKMTVRGNVPTQIFAVGTEKDMDAAVKECIEKGAPGGGFILAPGCAVPPNMKPENMKAFFRAANEYGAVDSVQRLI
jgi:uroporphyrinogen decarboxylase